MLCHFRVYSKVIQFYIYMIYVYNIYILFQMLFHYIKLLQDIEYSCLCQTVGPCCLSVLYIAVCIC